MRMGGSFIGASVAIVCLLAVSSVDLHGQTTAVTYATTTPSFNAGHDYIQMLDETVNPANGSLSLRIPIPTPPGRGLNFTYSLNYDSSSVYSLYPSPVGDDTSVQIAANVTTAAGWTNSIPTLTGVYSATAVNTGSSDAVCYWSSGFIFTDTTGEKHSFNITSLEGDTSGFGACGSQGAYNFVTDVTGKYIAVPNSPGNISIASADGVVYNFVYQTNTVALNGGTAQNFAYQPSSAANGIPFMASPPTIEDRNGNLITNDIDTLGRSLPSFLFDGTNPDGNLYNYPYTSLMIGAFSGSSDFSAPSQILSGCSSQGNNSPPNGTPAFTAPSSPPPVYGAGGLAQSISTFTLPDGNKYQFSYDLTYGLLNKITYPNGAYISYTWGLPTGWSDGGFYWSEAAPPPEDQSLPGFYTCAFQYSLPAITHLAVSYDGVHIARTQDFTYSTTFATSGSGQTEPQWATKSTIVSTHDLVLGANSTTTYNYLPGPIPGQESGSWMSGPVPLESSIVYQDGNGNTLETVNKSWYNTFANLLASEQTVLGSMGTGSTAPTSEVDYFYGGSSCCFRPLIETDEYDYTNSGGAQGVRGPLIRKVDNNYASFGSSPSLPAYTQTTQCNQPSCPVVQVPLSILADFPSSVITYNGSGAEVAETDYAYDQTAVASTSGVVQHDSQYSSNVPRANATSITRKCFGCVDSTTKFAYDNTGQTVSEMDPNLNTTTFSYTDSFSADNGQSSGNTNAYLTQITLPAVHGSSFTKTFSYGYNDGKLRNSTDENGQTTIYCYHAGGCAGTSLDPWLRLTQINYPDGGKTIATYNDTGANPSATVSKLINSATTEVSTTILDGMGHTIQTQLNSDPDGTDYTNIVYDGSGHVYQQTNPYRSTSDPTYGLTTTTYDALGRRLTVTKPDGSTVTSQYTGSMVDSWDENVTHMQHTTDALGRLVKVVELGTPADTRSLETDYGYDTLGNLTYVDQHGAISETPRTRSFTYDSLSRLSCASNPETSTAACPSSFTASYTAGTTSYAYDPNGNLVAKVSPQPSAPAGSTQTVTINYGYDTHNRLLSKTYGNAPAGTLSSCYVYDTGSIGNERLGAEWTGTCASTAPTFGYTTEKVFLAYDPMGRLKSEVQCTPATSGNCTTSNANVYSLNYNYDLSGNLVTYGNGVGSASGVSPFTFTNTFDGAGRLSTLTSSWSDSLHPSALFTADPTTGYTAAGSIQNMLLGDSISVNKNYDSRLRVTGETAVHP